MVDIDSEKSIELTKETIEPAVPSINNPLSSQTVSITMTKKAENQ